MLVLFAATPVGEQAAVTPARDVLLMLQRLFFWFCAAGAADVTPRPRGLIANRTPSTGGILREREHGGLWRWSWSWNWCWSWN
jgi:hypothetical protein